jgi:hypothetical protein
MVSGAHLGPATNFSFSLRFSFRQVSCELSLIKSRHKPHRKQCASVAVWLLVNRSCRKHLFVKLLQLSYGSLFRGHCPAMGVYSTAFYFSIPLHRVLTWGMFRFLYVFAQKWLRIRTFFKLNLWFLGCPTHHLLLYQLSCKKYYYMSLYYFHNIYLEWKL